MFPQTWAVSSSRGLVLHTILDLQGCYAEKVLGCEKPVAALISRWLLWELGLKWALVSSPLFPFPPS